MRPEDRTSALLWDMRSYGEAVLRLVGGVSVERYLGDEVLRLAVERALQVIGEAASQVPADFRAEHPQIEWARIVGLRHVLVHGYAKVDQETLWEIATLRVPELLKSLEPLIPPLPADSR